MIACKTFLAAQIIGFAVLPLSGTSSRAAEPRVSPGEPALPSAPERGLKAGDWLVRGGLVGSIPTHQVSSIGVIGGRVETPSALLPDGTISYFVTDHIAIEGQGGAVLTRPKIRDSRVGDIAIGSVWNAAAVGLVQYHFLPDGVINPYLGVGVSMTWPIAIEPEKGIGDFKLTSLTSAVLQAGFDVNLGGNWFGNVALKYVFVPPSGYAIRGISIKVDMDTLIVGAGVGYRF